VTKGIWKLAITFVSPVRGSNHHALSCLPECSRCAQKGFPDRHINHGVTAFAGTRRHKPIDSRPRNARGCHIGHNDGIIRHPGYSETAARPTFPAKVDCRLSNVQKSDTPKSLAAATCKTSSVRQPVAGVWFMA